MSKALIFLTFFCMLFLVQGLHARAQEAGDQTELLNQIRRAYYSTFDDYNQYATLDMLNHIRRERFDLILPLVMREKKIDMWIHVIRPWATDPLRFELGGNSGVFIFTDRGSDRIERAAFEGDVEDPSVYDIIGGESEFIHQRGYEIMDYVPEDPEEAPETQLDFRFMGLREFVAERDPRRIGVNYSKRLRLADGISYTDYSLLVKALGDKYANRMVSAEYLISDYLSRRVMNEIILYGEFGIKTAENLDREFAKVVPGITKLSDLEGIVFLRDPDGNEFSKSDPDDYVLQRGDLFTIGSGAGNRIMRVEFAGKGYVLREGETELSPEVKKIWEHGIKTREILQKNIKAGPTAGETLEIIKRKLEKAGYYYNPVDAYDKNADPEKTQVHLDLHAKGKRMLAPRISPLGPDWERDMKIPLLHTFAFEYMIHMPVPKWGRGKHLYIVFADVAVVTERGVEFPSPPDQGIRIIR